MGTFPYPHFHSFTFPYQAHLFFMYSITKRITQMNSKIISRYTIAIAVMLCRISPHVDAWSISCNGDTLASSDEGDFAGFESQYNYCVAVDGSLGFHTDSNEEYEALRAKLTSMTSRMSIDLKDVMQNEICAGSDISCSFPRKRTAGVSARGEAAVGPSIVVPESCSPSASACAMSAFDKLGVSAEKYITELFNESDGEREITSRRLATTFAPTTAAQAIEQAQQAQQMAECMGACMLESWGTALTQCVGTTPTYSNPVAIAGCPTSECVRLCVACDDQCEANA